VLKNCIAAKRILGCLANSARFIGNTLVEGQPELKAEYIALPVDKLAVKE